MKDETEGKFDYKIIYRKGKLNNIADALSQIEIHVKETTFWEQLDVIIRNFTDSELPPVTFDNVPNSSGTYPNEITVHSNTEQNSTLQFRIVDHAFKYGQNPLIISSVLLFSAKPKISILFEKKQGIYLQFSKNNLLNFVKEYIVPDVHY